MLLLTNVNFSIKVGFVVFSEIIRDSLLLVLLRKQVAVKKQDIKLYLDELRFSALVLSRDGLQSDDDDGSENEMGEDEEDGDEFDSMRLKKLAAQVCKNSVIWQFKFAFSILFYFLFLLL